MKETTKKPRLRFKGFTDDWEQRKLSDVAEISMGQSPNGENYTDNPDDTILVQGNADIKNGWVKPRIYTKQETKIAEKGDIILTVRAPVGEVALTKYRVVLGRGVAGIKASMFIYHLLRKYNTVNYWRIYSTGSTFESINSDDIKNANVLIPNEEESVQVASLFSSIDYLITANQRQLDKLQELKKGLLQKMFPKNGAKIPELRFDGFTDDWEQRKLGELSDIRRGASPRPIKSKKWFSEDSDVGWLRISDVTEQHGKIEHVEQHLSEAGIKKTLVLEEPHLILSIAASVGKPVINYIKTGIHDGFIVFLNPKFNINFMYQFLEFYESSWQKYGQPGAQVNINSELVRNLQIFIPNTTEQKVVSNIFIKVDDLITANQRQLDKLQELKKSLLQKMFI
ncbi:restriction endonuclease subunit S [Lentilactobacillus sp. Marseille-Q4993]|uniref:restriction endonuclease subunit S n=1 Tax=Lentilactobacillus sp. Marseille-Q4993 TaxID=3039492 RepID=UPI0024BC5FD4|nr:restriction endonuclease subunit S [Lentilactobacillus sp. Marseille-Q4993]